MQHKTLHGTQTPERVQSKIGDQTLFQCRKCLSWLPPEGFNKLNNPRSKTGKLSECKKCRNTYMRDRLRRKAGWTEEEIAANKRHGKPDSAIRSTDKYTLKRDAKKSGHPANPSDENTKSAA